MQAIAFAATQRLSDPGTQPAEVDHHLAHPRSRQALQVVLDQRPPRDGNQWLGGVVGQRPHPLATTGSEYESTWLCGRH